MRDSNQSGKGISLKERVIIEVKSLYEAFNREKVKEAVEYLVREGVDAEEEKRELYRIRFRELLQKRIKVNWAGMLLGPFWLSYRNRPVGALYMSLLSYLIQVLLAQVAIKTVASHPLITVISLILLILVALAPYLYAGFLGDAYLAVSLYKGLSIRKNLLAFLLYLLSGFILFSVLDALFPLT